MQCVSEVLRLIPTSLCRMTERLLCEGCVCVVRTCIAVLWASMVYGSCTLRVQFQVFTRSKSEGEPKTAQRVQTLAPTEA